MSDALGYSDTYNLGYEADTEEGAIRAIFGKRADALLELLAQNNMNLKGWMPGKADPRVVPQRRALGLLPPSGSQSNLAALITQAIVEANRLRSIKLDGVPETARQFSEPRWTGEPIDDPAGSDAVDHFEQRLNDAARTRYYGSAI